MATLAELLVKKAALDEARFSGARRVRYADGSETEYKSESEMRAASAELDRLIAAASGSPRVSMIRISSSKGT